MYGMVPSVTFDVVESPTAPRTVPNPKPCVPAGMAGETNTIPASAFVSVVTSGIQPLTTIVPNLQDVIDVAATFPPSLKTTRVPPYVGPRCGEMEC